jgi:hypothetical protein
MLVFARLIANPENHDKVDEIKESLWLHEIMQ